MGNISINNITGGTVPYTIKVYQVGNGNPIFTDTTNSSSYAGSFSHVNGQSYYAVVEKNGCTPYTSGNSTLNCTTCNISLGSINYSCFNNGTTVYTVNLTIVGGNGSYKYSTNNGGDWINTGSNLTFQALVGQTVIIANSDLSCQTPFVMNPDINPCELCFNLSYNSVNVSCVTGSSERKRVTMEISNTVTSGCPSGDYQYSDDNGNTWTTTVSSFNKIYDGYGSNTILLRYSLYPSKIWTVNVPAFNPNCSGYGVFSPTTCSCEINGGTPVGGDWCVTPTRQFRNIPNSPSTYLASVSNPANSQYYTPIALGYSNPSGQPFRLVFSKTGGTFLNGTTTYDTGYISGLYLFQTSVYGGQSVSVTIRSENGGINCASTSMICGTSVASAGSNTTFSWDTCVYNESGCNACSGLEFSNNIASIYWNERIYI